MSNEFLELVGSWSWFAGVPSALRYRTTFLTKVGIVRSFGRPITTVSATPNKGAAIPLYDTQLRPCYVGVCLLDRTRRGTLIDASSARTAAI